MVGKRKSLKGGGSEVSEETKETLVTTTRRKTKRLRMAKAKTGQVFKTFDELLEARNRSFLNDNQATQYLKITMEYKTCRTKAESDLDHLYLMNQAKNLYKDCVAIYFRQDQVLYLQRLGSILAYFFEKSSQIHHRLRNELSHALNQIKIYLQDWDEKFILPNIPFGTKYEIAGFEKNYETLQEIMMSMTKYLIHYRDCLVPPTTNLPSETVRLFARTVVTSQMTLADVYVWQFDPDQTSQLTIPKDICPSCKNPFIYQSKDSLQTCNTAGCPLAANSYNFFNMTHHTMEYSKANTTQAHDYERRKFFERWLAQFCQGSRPIPPKVLSYTKARLLDYGITGNLDVKQTTCKTIISKCEDRTISCYASSAAKVANILCNTTTREFTPEQRLRVLERAKAVEDVFTYFKRNANNTPQLRRVNFPNFNYLVRQICMNENWPAMKTRFRLPKLEDSRRNQEAEWMLYIPQLQKMDKKHKWVFIPTK